MDFIHIRMQSVFLFFDGIFEISNGCCTKAAVGGARERPVSTRVNVVAASTDVIRLLPAVPSFLCACAPSRLRSRKIAAAAVSLTLSTSSAGAQERRSRRRARATSTLHSPAPSREIAPQQSRPSPSISRTSRCGCGKRVSNGAAHQG